MLKKFIKDKAINIIKQGTQNVIDDNIRYSIFSYIQNDFMLNQRKDKTVFDSETYKYLKQIKECTKIYKTEKEKIRVGSKNDGGYVMVKPFSKNKIAYSIGIGDNISWDLDMVNNEYIVFQYDHTIKKAPKKNENLYWKKIGLSGEKETYQLKQLETLIKENNHCDSDGMVLKMDIEGSEYSVINQCSCLDKFDQVVIEFHNLVNPINKNSTIDALKKMNELFDVVHVHANNHSKILYCGDIAMPDLLEVTYIKKSKSRKLDNSFYPTIFDYENIKNRQEIFLGDWNK